MEELRQREDQLARIRIASEKDAAQAEAQRAAMAREAADELDRLRKVMADREAEAARR